MSTTEMISEKEFEKVSAEAGELVLHAEKPRISRLKRALVTMGIYRGQIETPSASLASIRYKRSARTLDVAFRNGAAYRYFDVQPEDVSELLAAPSIGRQFNKHLRNDFSYQLIRGRLKPSVSEQKQAKTSTAKAAKSTKTAVPV